MKNSFIPIVFKEKLIKIFGWFKASLFFLLGAAIFLSIFTFNINDSSFLTESSAITSNIFGKAGSYLASFLIYSFGLMSYLIVFFLLINSIATFRKKDLRYFFIRLLFFLVGIVLIPQVFLFRDWTINYIDQIEVWGKISYLLFNLHQAELVSYLLSFIGLILFFFYAKYFFFFSSFLN